jgi:two-component system, cell cycle sensor histidine kinase and response regulator CckA
MVRPDVLLDDVQDVRSAGLRPGPCSAEGAGYGSPLKEPPSGKTHRNSILLQRYHLRLAQDRNTTHSEGFSEALGIATSMEQGIVDENGLLSKYAGRRPFTERPGPSGLRYQRVGAAGRLVGIAVVHGPVSGSKASALEIRAIGTPRGIINTAAAKFYAVRRSGGLLLSYFRSRPNVNVSNEMYRRIVEAVPEGIWVVDPQGRTIFSNQRMAEILGVDFESMSEQSCFACVFPDELADAQRHFARTLTGDRRPFDFRLRRADGSPIWVSISCMAMCDDTGAPVGLLGLFSDITERKRAEAELRESEARFRNMADTAPVMIWVTGPDKLFTFFNKTWLDFTGRTMDQELGNGWANGVHPEDLHRCYETFSSSFDARQAFHLECRLRRADGEYRWLLCSGVPRFAPGGVFAGYIGSDIDITNLQSEERFRELAENIDQVYWMLDLETNKILYVSPAFEKVWGCASAALCRNCAWLVETVHAEDRDRFIAFSEKDRSRPVEEFYRIVRPDGSVRWIHDRSFPVRDPGGRPYRAAGIAEDITARREMEEQLRQAQKMEALGRLAGGIAHDFNNLLTVVGGYAHVLLQGTPPGDLRHDKLKQILTASNRASALTSQLLAFGRKQMLQPKPVNLNNLLCNMEALLRRVMGEHIKLRTILRSDLPCVEADPNQLEQVLINLAANARDAMPEGGEFRIRTTLVEAQAGADFVRDTGPWVRIEISDTGCGMSQDVLEHIFEPFFTTKGVGKGTGLGLSSVYGIIQQNHGTIHVSSNPSRGTIFEILFPAVPESEERPAPPQPFESLAENETILVAEDEPDVRKLVQETLEEFGYTVLQAADGNEALRILEQHGPVHLLLTDVIMPLMGGRELAKRVIALWPTTKVVYMSGYTDDTLAFYELPRQDTAYIQKPFTPVALAEKLRGVLSAGRKPNVDR